MRRSVVNDLLNMQRQINDIIPTVVDEECLDGIDSEYVENLERRLISVINQGAEYLRRDIRKDVIANTKRQKG